MTLYDLLTSGHKVWLVYDAFYSNGEEDQETFENMVAHSVKMNFRHFMEISEFRKYSKAVEDQDKKEGKSLSVRDIPISPKSEKDFPIEEKSKEGTCQVAM